VNVKVRGYIWQRYDLEIHAGLDRGVTLAGVAAERLGEPHVEHVAGADVVRWPESRFIQYDKNLLPKVLFWPVTLGALWLMTIRTFY
jgi:hypothetical protein